MPGSAFTIFDKISTMMAKASSATLKGASATFDDAITGAKMGAGVVTDDIPVKSKSFLGMMQDREIPAFKRIIAGSLKTRAWMLPTAVGINAFAPGLLAPLLMLGGSVLCFEGAEKVIHTIQHKLAAHKDEGAHDDHKADVEETMTPDEFEDDMVKGFLSTDIIMAAELTGIMLATMVALPWFLQLAALSASTAALGVGVYGLVFTLIRADNVAMHLSDKPDQGLWNKTQRAIGHNMLKVIPPMMKGLSVIGTGAMFMVGGELIAGHIPAIEHMIKGVGELAGAGAAPLVEVGLASLFGVGVGVGVVAGEKVTRAPRAFIGKTLSPYMEKLGKALSPALKAVKDLSNKLAPKRQKKVENVSVTEPAAVVVPVAEPSKGLTTNHAAPGFSAAVPAVEAQAVEAAPKATHTPKPPIK